jgi:TolB protein
LRVQVDISGVGATQFPIAIAQPTAAGSQQISHHRARDLERSASPWVDANGAALNEASRPVLTEWRVAVPTLAVGSIALLADGRIDVRFKLWTRPWARPGGQAHAVAEADQRLVAHRTPISLREAHRRARSLQPAPPTSPRLQRYTPGWLTRREAQVANSTEPIISPAWSPNGNELAYVS